MKNWSPIVLTVGILALIYLFVPRLLDIVEKATKPPTTDDLVKAIQAANAKAAKEAEEKAAAEAAKKK